MAKKKGKKGGKKGGGNKGGGKKDNGDGVYKKYMSPRIPKMNSVLHYSSRHSHTLHTVHFPTQTHS